MKPNVVAVIQARMGSTRLPGKVLEPLSGRAMLERVVERTACTPSIDKVVVATSQLAGDDGVEALVGSLPEVGLVRGSEDDVLSRYYTAAVEYNADVVVRITADCPLIDPGVSDRVVRAFLDHDGPVDYASNCHVRSFPRGLDTEVVSRSLIEHMHHNATDAAEREHVTRYLWLRKEQYRVVDLVDDQDHSHLRWTVDTPDDMALVRKIYVALVGPMAPASFSYAEVLELLARNPTWSELNAHVPQKTI